MAQPAGPPPAAAGPQAPHAAFFGPVARGNPVVDSFEAELRRVLSSLRRLRGAGEAKHDLHRHGANTLFNIWIKYKPRLPEWYYNERLVKVGDSLVEIKVSTIHIYTICRHLMVMGQSAKFVPSRTCSIHDDLLFSLCQMSVMIFKRAVYASRRKSNSFRRESKVNPRKAVNVSWPRTTTERLLVAMFDGAAAQFLAILEALSDRSRNLLPPHPPVPDEMQIRDVTSELFSAGLEILSGGKSNGTNHFGIINPSSTLLQLMIAGNLNVIEMLFIYYFLMRAQDDPTWKKAEIELKLLALMQPIVFPGKFERIFSISDDGDSREGSTHQGSEKTQTVRSECCSVIAMFEFQIFFQQENVHPDKEILVDVVMCLWQKCKMELQQIQTSGSHCLEYIHKHQAYQWVHILWIMNEIIEKSNIAGTNVMFAEITLCIAVILENVADSTSESKEKEGGSASLLQDEACDMPEILMKTPTEQLQIAYEILEKALNDMNTSRLMTLLPDGKSIFDSCCMKVDSNDQNLNSVLGCGDDKTGTSNGFVTDLHLELIQAQHRVAVKLLKITQGAQIVDRSPKSSKSHEKNIEDFQYLSEELILKKIKRNKLSRAIFLMQKAAQKFPEDLTTTSQ
ncbi:Cilia- and flagella-associated protein 54, partial [Lonchura striata]